MEKEIEIKDFQELEFSDEQIAFINYAKNEYRKQIYPQYVNLNPPSTNEQTLALLDVIDEINDESFKPGKPQPSCTKGCAHCCHIQVSATSNEVDVILDYMKHKAIEFNDKDKEKLRNQALIKDDKEYILSLDRRCVFLGQDNLCQIYEARPSACRNYYVFNDPKDCDTYSNHNKTGKTLVHFDLNAIAPILVLMEESELSTMPKHLVNKLNL